MKSRAWIGVWAVVGVGAAAVVLFVAARWRFGDADERPTTNFAATPAAADSPVSAEVVRSEPSTAAEFSTVAAGGSNSGGSNTRGSSAAGSNGGGLNGGGSFANRSYASSGSYSAGSYSTGSYGNGSWNGSAVPYRVATGKIYPGGSAGLMPFGSSGGGNVAYASGAAPRGSAGWTGYSSYPTRSAPNAPSTSTAASSTGNPALDRKLAELEARAAALEQSIERLLPLVTK